MAKKYKIIDCPECHGTGKTNLPDELQTIYDILVKGKRTAREVCDRLRLLNPSDAHLRLDKLVRMGLVKKYKPEKRYVFEIKDEATASTEQVDNLAS